MSRECRPPVAAVEWRASRVACPAFFVASNIRTSADYCRRLDKNMHVSSKQHRVAIPIINVCYRRTRGKIH